MSKPLPPYRRNGPARELRSTHAHRIRVLFEEMLAAHAENPLTAEEIHHRCGIISRVTQLKLSPCANCTRLLTARQRMRPCEFCGFEGNWKHAVAEAEKRQNKELEKELKEAREYERKRRAEGYVFE